MIYLKQSHMDYSNAFIKVNGSFSYMYLVQINLIFSQKQATPNTISKTISSFTRLKIKSNFDFIYY